MRIQLLTQGDDFGSSRSATEAIIESFDHGVLRNASIMVPTPYFEESARRFAKTKELCWGLHCTITAEWERVRWGPLLPPEQLPSLVDGKGHFLHSTSELYRNQASPDEIMAELSAQLAAARRAGFELTYVDTHMRFEWIHHELTERMAEWCRCEGLIFYKPYDHALPVDNAVQDPVERLLQALPQTKEGQYLHLVHPAYDDAETRMLGNAEQTGEHVAWERNRDRFVYQDAEVLRAFDRYGVKPVRYDEIEVL